MTHLLWLQLPSNGLVDSLPDDFKQGFRLLVGFLCVLWALEILDLVMRGALDRFGIRPRQPAGLLGILFAPFLHGDLGHLAANTGPLAILGTLILLDGAQTWLIVTLMAWLVGGLGVWLLGRPRTNHLGASGLVFGYLGFLLLRGYFVQSPAAIAIATLVGFLYGGALWGLLPLQRGRSWSGHLFGFVGGAIAARYLAALQTWGNSF
ncbi:MAG TPA: rhomboid family intramembrane serine protease [Trichocoleus sp.]